MLLVAAFTAALVSGVGGAGAAALTVHAGGAQALVLGRCQSSPVTVTAVPPGPGAAVTSLALAGLDTAACGGRAVRVEVIDPSADGGWSSAVRASGTTTVEAAAATVATGSFVPTGALTARVVIDGWTVPSTWSVAAAVGLRCVDASGLGRSCTVVVDRYQVWHGGYRLDFHVVTTSLLPFRYEVQADLSATGLDVGAGRDAFPGWPVPAAPGHPTWYPVGVRLTNACIVTSADDLPVIALRGAGTGWNDLVALGWPARALGFQVDDTATFPSGAGCRW